MFCISCPYSFHPWPHSQAFNPITFTEMYYSPLYSFATQRSFPISLPVYLCCHNLLSPSPAISTLSLLLLGSSATALPSDPRTCLLSPASQAPEIPSYILTTGESSVVYTHRISYTVVNTWDGWF